MESGATRDEVLLDLLNTTPLIDGVVHDRLAGDREARQWLGDHGLHAGGADLDLLREARDALQRVVRGDALAKLSQLLLHLT